MLRHLSIQNYALIEKQQIDFERGLSAITGETGSGKSILLGAFGLLLGARAESKSIKDPEKKCIVEALFNLTGYDLPTFFAEHDLDFDAQTSIRREIAPGGKSRAFVNDTPVSLQLLKELGEKLVDIHSQHENSVLGERSFQFELIDTLAGQQQEVRLYKKLFAAWQAAQHELRDLLANEAARRQEQDYLQFQYQELTKWNLDELPLVQMEQELETLSNAELIRNQLSTATQAIGGENSSVTQVLSSLKPQLAKISGYHEQLSDFYNRLESCTIELKELAREMEIFEGSIHFDAQKIEQLQEQLSQVYQLQQKHRTNSLEELIALRDQIAAKLEHDGNMDERIVALQQSIAQGEAELRTLAERISQGRADGAKLAQSEIGTYFKELSLDHAELKLVVEQLDQLNSYGLNEVQMLFRANVGSQLLPIKQVASGGEISRVMLAIKAAVAKHKQLPVLILDEIDQGVSGEVGRKIGVVLKEMSNSMQLLTITHLPQIAGKAQHHFKVFKETGDDTTTTRVVNLRSEERVRELAEMLSGKSITNAALANARELLESK